MPFQINLGIPSPSGHRPMLEILVKYDYHERPSNKDLAFLAVLAIYHCEKEITEFLDMDLKLEICKLLQEHMLDNPATAEELAKNDAEMASVREKSELFQSWLSMPDDVLIAQLKEQKTHSLQTTSKALH